jgi:aminoglycoside phosphotransferase (APT) family kinase protein
VTPTETLVREIAQRHELRPGRVNPVVGHGSVNRVFVVDSGASRFVVRFAIDPLRHDEFEVEEWCLAQAAAHGIPSPEVVARSSLRGVPYLIETFVEGTPGTRHPSLDTWPALAAYAHILHTIPVTDDAPEGLFSRFGREPAAAWRAHLTYNIDQLTATDPLLRLGVYPAELQIRIRGRLSTLRECDWSYGLRHADLFPRNLIVPPQGVPVLIDWGSASTGPVPFGDLLPVVREQRATGYPPVNELREFAAALGAPLDEVGDTVESLLLLDALDLVRWAINKRPDRLHETVVSARAHVATAPL